MLYKLNIHIPVTSILLLLFYRKLRQYDLVVFNQEMAFPLAIVLPNTTTIVHGSSLLCLKEWLREKELLRAIYYGVISINTILTYIVSKRIFTVSECTAKEIRPFNRRVKVCGWGVDLDFWGRRVTVKKEEFGINQNTFVLLFVGRFDKGKGSDKLIEIMRRLKEQEDIKLICVSKKKEHIEVTKNIIFIGTGLPEEMLRKIYNIADIVLFPTRYEGYGSVIGEAIATRTRIITTATGIGCELKNMNIDGVTVLDTNANVEAFVERILKEYKLWKSKGRRKIKIKDEDMSKVEPLINLKRAMKCWRAALLEGVDT